LCPPQNDIVLITDYCWRSWTCRIAAPYKFYVDWLIDMPLNISSLIINSASVSLDFTALYKSCFCYFIYLNKVEQETVEQETSILVHVIIFWQHKGHTASYNVQRNENDNCRQIEAATSLIIQMSWAKRFILGQWRLKWTQKDSILEKMQRRLFNTRNPRILRLQSIKFQLSLAWHTAIHGCQKKMRNSDRRRVYVFKMWCFRKLLKISQTQLKINERIVNALNETTITTHYKHGIIYC